MSTPREAQSASSGTDDLTGKVALVTGGTSGIGYAASVALAQRGATVVLGGRDRERTAKAAAAITEQTGNPRVEYVIGDLAESHDVRAVATEVSRRHPRLDILVNNAGGAFSEYGENSAGVERTLAVNYLAPFLLTESLMPALLAASSPIVINIGSSAHRNGRIAWGDLNLSSNYDGMRAYAQAKLAVTMLTQELARRTADTHLVVATVDPGAVATNFFVRPEMATLSGPMKVLSRIFARFAKSPAEGAATAVWLAAGYPDGRPSGKLWDPKKRMVTPAVRARDVDAHARLWQVGARLTGQPESTEADTL